MPSNVPPQSEVTPDSKSPARTELDASTLSPSSVGVGRASMRILALTVLFHPQIDRIGERAPLPALSSGRRVPLSRLEPTFAAAGSGEKRTLADAHLSRRPAWFRQVSDGVEMEGDEAGTTIEVNGRPLAENRLLSSADLVRGVVLMMANCVVLLLHELEPRPGEPSPDLGLVGASDAMTHLRRQIRRAAEHKAPVLLRGETGTGKELVAMAIHRAGPRRDRPYVTMNLGAVPSSLAATELFGANRGAYTGADRDQRGFFRRADGGTLLLDEVGETPSAVQPLLLRALESGEIQPLGASKAYRVDVRLIAATDANLEEKITEGRFRAPLLHRLAGVEIRLPPLRERREDIGLLLIHFLRCELEALGSAKLLNTDSSGRRLWLPAKVVARLALFDWVGNVRQLRNTARQLAIIAGDASPGESNRVVDELIGLDSVADPNPDAEERKIRTVATVSYRQPHEVSHKELLAALRANKFGLKPTAKRLGLSRTSLYALIDQDPQIRRASQIESSELEACRERHSGDLDAMAEELEVSRHGLQRRLRELRIGQKR